MTVSLMLLLLGKVTKAGVFYLAGIITGLVFTIWSIADNVSDEQQVCQTYYNGYQNCQTTGYSFGVYPSLIFVAAMCASLILLARILTSDRGRL